MTSGYERALRELRRLVEAAPGVIEAAEPTEVMQHLLLVRLSIQIGPLDIRDGGLDLQEREEFDLFIFPDFPFTKPVLKVSHRRFAGFPHVIWGEWICLYQSDVEWNPSDGLFGFFDRLRNWLIAAALNDMDPVGGPLEPPHHATDLRQNPFIVRSDAPVPPGERWLGLAGLEKHGNRTELVSWHSPTEEPPATAALAIMLPESIPMEFPVTGADFFSELTKQGFARSDIVHHLALAALFTEDGDPIHLVVGLPMRRATNGERRLHIAVWTVEATRASSLRLLFSHEGDSEETLRAREDLADALTKVFELGPIYWCRVLEDRPEIVVRRDIGRPLAWFANRKILILGCGALGSWAAEIVARAEAGSLTLVDNAIVKPGLLVRQNFALADIGANKAEALALRLGAVAQRTTIDHCAMEAHAFIRKHPEKVGTFDCVLDCTASAILQMKLERDWPSFNRPWPPFVSLMIDSSANYCAAVTVPPNSNAGTWDAYVNLRRSLSGNSKHRHIRDAFYTHGAAQKLFQPEPGCSDPTFVGSTADIMALVSGGLNASASALADSQIARSFVTSNPTSSSVAPIREELALPLFCNAHTSTTRVRLASSILSKARGWVRQNARLRTAQHETGGLLWGHWDDTLNVIWIWDLSGPPSDSGHRIGHFACGVNGTGEEHQRRLAASGGLEGFVGYWHTHPDLPSSQSSEDIRAMCRLVSRVGLNQRRSAMVIFGRTNGAPSAGLYLYESTDGTSTTDLVTAGSCQMPLPITVV